MKHFFQNLLSGLLLVFASVTWAQAAPLSSAELNIFLARVGFDPSPTELASYTGFNQAQLAQRIVAQSLNNAAVPAPPHWVADAPVTLQMRGEFSVEARNAYRMQQAGQAQVLRQWWLRGMLTTPTPLRERMVLFWHNHFPSSQQKVIDTHMIWAQHEIMRKHALGNFSDLLNGVVRSPAMLEYLDAPQNRIKAPNENLARELMELFTLGQGKFSEQDVKQAARALTGWGINRSTNQFQFLERQHEPGIKQLVGMPVDNGGDVLDVLLMQRQTARYITGKLWQEFISPVIDEQRVEALSQQFYSNKYNIAALMQALLSEPALLADSNRAALVKSPVELLVGTARRFSIVVNDERALLQPLAAMGQLLFAHPSVKGWATGEAWISANTLLARKQGVAAWLNARPAMSSSSPNSMMPSTAPSPQSPNASSSTLANTPGAVLQALVLKPDVWLTALQMPAQRSLNASEQTKLIAHVLHSQPATPLDSSLEALPALKALISDIAYQVK